MRNGLLLAALGAALAAAPAATAAPTFVEVGSIPGDSDVMDLTGADVNGDGRQDLVVTGWRNTVTVLVARPGGGHDIAGPFAVGLNPTRPLVVDVDANGRTDIVTAQKHGGPVTVLHGAAGGGFTRTDHPGPPAREDVHEIGRTQAVAAADVTGDGRLDLALASTRLDAMFVLAQTDEGFAAPVAHPGLYAHDVAAGDVTGDGRADLVLANGAWVEVLAALPGGGLAPPVKHAGSGQRVLVRDLDGDGHDDVVVGSDTILRGRPGGLAPNADHALDVLATSVADLDGDGVLDLAGVTGTDGVVAGLLGNAAAPWSHTFGVRVNAERMGIADHDDDGRPDLFVLDHWAGGIIRVLANRTPRLTLGAVEPDWSRLELPYGVAFRRDVAEVEVALKRPGADSFSVRDVQRPQAKALAWVSEPRRLAEGEWRIRLTARGHDGRVLETAEAAVVVEHPFGAAAGIPYFGEQPVGGTSEIKRVRLENQALTPLRVRSLTVSGAEFKLLHEDCTGQAVGYFAGCYADVVFTPAAEGPRRGALEYTSNGGFVDRLELRGVGVPALAPSSAPEPVRPTPTAATRRRPSLTFAAMPGRTSTRLTNLRLRDIPSGSVLTVRCSDGCPIRSLTLRRAGGTVSLAGFASRRLPAGAAIKITLAPPSQPRRRITLTVRAGRAPRVTGSL